MLLSRSHSLSLPPPPGFTSLSVAVAGLKSIRSCRGAASFCFSLTHTAQNTRELVPGVLGKWQLALRRLPRRHPRNPNS